MTDTERYRRAAEAFDEVVELDPDERTVRLAELASLDPELAREVESLLAAAAGGGPLAAPVLDLASPLFRGERAVEAANPPSDGETENETGPDREVGPFRLLRRLGEGGMGEVWLAERSDSDFAQEVALKLLRPGLARPELAARFRRERAILARLEHPHIAHFVDGGLTPAGQPYFAMERVEGESITDYCSRRSLATEERLRLFLDVCDAVAFAHQNLIVHRDLKPSNVLVTSEGAVKLLDFGIAKVLAGDDNAESGADRSPTVLTELDERPMTLAYAAPEQILGGAVTTATDVYALGALLYELLTGERPFEAPNRLDLERAIVDTEPKRPSTRVSTATGQTSPSAPSDRRALARHLRGDLDAILLKALRKEPERRYPRVEALADDLRAFIAGRPVGARGDAVSYRAAKFVRRHRFAVAASALALVGLLSGLAAALWQTRVARREATRARTVKAFLVSTFGEARPEVAQGEETTARVILERGLARIDRDLGDDPELQAEMLETVASIQSELGEYPKSSALWQRAIALRDAAADLEPLAAAGARLGLAEASVESGELERAERAASEALETLVRERGPAAPETLEARRILGGVHRRQGKIDLAQSELTAVVEGLRRRLPEDDEAITVALGSLANARFDAAKLAESEALFREVAERQERAHGADSLQAASALEDLAVSLDEQERNAEAEAIYSRSIAIREKVLGPDHPSVGASLKNLGVLYQSTGRFAEATAALERSIAIFESALGPDSYGVADATNTLGVADYVRGDYESAERRLGRALAIWKKTLGPEHPSTLTVAANRAAILAEMGRLEEAEAIDAEVLAVRRKQGREDDNLTAALNIYGDILSQRGGVDAALAIWDEALAINRRIWGADSPILATGLWYQGRALRERGSAADRARARTLLEQGLGLLEARADPNPSHLANTLLELGRLDLDAGRGAAAETRLARATTLRHDALGETNWKTAEARSEWARALAAIGRDGDARRELDASLVVLGSAKPLRAQRALDVARRSRAALG